jgi:hypothetical protein
MRPFHPKGNYVREDGRKEVRGGVEGVGDERVSLLKKKREWRGWGWKCWWEWQRKGIKVGVSNQIFSTEII